MSATPDTRLDRLDPRDRAHAEGLEPGERDVVVATVARYRRPERLAVGDRLPAPAAISLVDRSAVELPRLADERPLLLVFGSFT